MAKKVRDAIVILEAHGWRQIRQRGSHRQFKHSEFAATVTLAGKWSDTIPVGQLASIRRHSGIEELR
jgi:predicted RNA binding protein YcfA (HicA-like mRNA interferase family)